MSAHFNYPGDLATADDILALANAYRDIAHVIEPHAGRKDALRSAPLRLVVNHAIELYFNAALIHNGRSSSEIRGMQHDLESRATLAEEIGIVFRRRTREHLYTLHESRDYLTARYEPTSSSIGFHRNRLIATLDEVAEKVTDRLKHPGSSTIS